MELSSEVATGDGNTEEDRQGLLFEVRKLQRSLNKFGRHIAEPLDESSREDKSERVRNSMTLLRISF